MRPPVPPVLFTVLLFAGMLLFLEVGRRLAITRRGNEESPDVARLGTIEGAVFALFGLLMAFTFSGAASRFNEKRMLIPEEANAIGTAFLRLNLLPEQSQPNLQRLFLQYADSRLETYRKLPDMKAAELEIRKSRTLQDEIWRNAVAAARLPDSQPAAAILVVPALNHMIDIVTTRSMALQLHPPNIVYALLFGLALICSMLAGYRMAGGYRNWLHILGFAVITVTVVYVTLDIEYPRTGLFRLDAADQALVEVRDAISAHTNGISGMNAPKMSPGQTGRHQRF